MQGRLVTVFGGSGFIGRYVVERLAKRGDRVRVAVRRPNQALFLKPLGELGQVQPWAADIKDDASVTRAVAGADAVVNLVGILHGAGTQTFDAVQAEGAKRVAEAATAAGVKTLVQMSAIGADAASEIDYVRTKGEAEVAVKAAFKGATVLRPSLVAGFEDGVFNRFAAMAAMMPVLVMPGTATKFQPTCVHDVADAVLRALEGDTAVAGKTFELGGPEVMTLRELLALMMRYTGVHRPVIDPGFGLMKFVSYFTGLLPNPPLTPSQVEMLKSDNVVAKGAKGYKALGIAPEPVETVLAKYAVQYRPQGQFSKVDV